MAQTVVVPIPISMGPMLVNAYLLIGERVVVVDTGVPGNEERILGAVSEQGREPADVSLILLTHGHGDHTGSAAGLREATGAPVALAEGDLEKARLGFDLEMRGRGLMGRTLLAVIRRRNARRPSSPSGPEPDIVITGEFPLGAYGMDAVAVPTPGHSRGSLSVFTEAGDALVGDILGGGGRSRKAPTRGIFVSDEDAMDASIREIIARAPRLTYTGHDAHPFTLAELREAFPELS
jgi:glyoxylase-like metal-dependent hydrolase (beta-lactamase superfamily II)